jgi:hypothetical protein
MRLVEMIRRSMPEVIIRSGAGLNESDYLAGLHLAIGMFNSYPPETYFRLDNFPKSHEYFLVGLATLTTLASRFLTLSIRDWNYSEPGGVVMQIDRGAKINQALQIITQIYTANIGLVKLDFAGDYAGMGLGTISLPLGYGSTISRGSLNILDIFSMIS